MAALPFIYNVRNSAFDVLSLPFTSFLSFVTQCINVSLELVLLSNITGMRNVIQQESYVWLKIHMHDEPKRGAADFNIDWFIIEFVRWTLYVFQLHK